LKSLMGKLIRKEESRKAEPRTGVYDSWKRNEEACWRKEKRRALILKVRGGDRGGKVSCRNPTGEGHHIIGD